MPCKVSINKDAIRCKKAYDTLSLKEQNNMKAYDLLVPGKYLMEVKIILHSFVPIIMRN